MRILNLKAGWLWLLPALATGQATDPVPPYHAAEITACAGSGLILT